MIIFFFHFFTLLTNTFLKDENIKFSLRKYKKYDKYIRMLIMNYIREKLPKKGLKNSKIELKI